MKKLRIAICGCEGHAEKFGQMINSYEESEMAAVWDNEPDRGRKIAESLNCPFEPDYDRLISEYAPDGVIIVAANCWHKELVIKAAEAGIHIFLEKPLCVSVSDAFEMRDAVKKNNVKFYMSDPFVKPPIIAMKKLIDDGTLGQITGARFRLGSDIVVKGFRNAERYDKSVYLGGIMSDIGGHMIHIAHYLFGKPESISSVTNCYTRAAKDNEIEENTVITMVYPDGNLVEIDCSWLSGGNSSTRAVYGTLGWAEVPAGTRDQTLAYQIGRDSVHVLEGDDLPPDPLPHVRYWVKMMTEDLPNDIVGVDPLSNSGVSIDNAVEFVEILDAIYRGANKGLTKLS